MKERINFTHLQRLAPATPGDAAGQISIEDVRKAQAVRQIISKLFPRDRLRECDWDMLLEVLSTSLRNRPVYVKELVAISGEKPTTALRRISHLERIGLLKRRNDQLDNRRMEVNITENGKAAIGEMLQQMAIWGIG